MKRRVLVTHADQPIGRRIVKTLWHDEEVERIVAVGEGAPPHAFDRFLSAPAERLVYVRADLSRHRPAWDLFRSTRVREARVDSVVHVPAHGAAPGATSPLAGGVAGRTAEARLVLQHCLELPPITSLVALGSAYVYRLAPGNANRLTEASELDLDPELAPEIRSWIDCDMLFHAEVGHARLRVALLRVPTVVTSGGFAYWNPTLAPGARVRLRPLGFDPLCALVSDKDVAHAVRRAVCARAHGIFNVAGREAVPLSLLCRWTGRPSLGVPSVLLRAARGGGDHLRYGFTLDTRRAERELGFRPRYRVGLARSGDGRLRLETAPI
jgi:nucleoside-diphosphate-sugar epimerase